MTGHEGHFAAKLPAQKAEKLSVEDIARKQLDKAFFKEFSEFLDFLKKEKIRVPWKSINGFKLVYKSKTVGGLTLGAGGWLDNNIETKNYVLIHIGTTERSDYDAYLEDQPKEIAALFMEQISNKCIHCRPSCGCSKVSGRTISVSGKHHKNVCMNAPGFKFFASGSGLQNMTMGTPRAVYPPETFRDVPLETVKKLILARKAYIDNFLTAKNSHP